MQSRCAFVLVVLSFSGATLAACSLSDVTPMPEKDAGPPRVVIAHRASRGPCSSTRAPGRPLQVPGGGRCTTDSDCRDGANGRCNGVTSPVGNGGSSSSNVCSYDDCTVDEDCPNGGVCECRFSEGSANRCLAADCRVDADCREVPFCSPSARYDNTTLNPYPKPKNIAKGYFCHRYADECSSDNDCPDLCSFRSDLNHWACTTFLGEN